MSPPAHVWSDEHQRWLETQYDSQYQRYYRKHYVEGAGWVFFDWLPAVRPGSGYRAGEAAVPVARFDQRESPMIRGNYGFASPQPDSHYEKLVPTYYVRERSFFCVGRVFSVPFTEPASSSATSYNSAVSLMRYTESKRTPVRRFIVIHLKRDYFNAVPIFSYNGQGTKKPGVVSKQHAIAYAYGTAPVLLPEEKVLEKDPICIILNHDIPWSPASRVYLGVHHSVMYNVKAKDLGYVDPKDIPKLLNYGSMELQRDTSQATEVTAEAAKEDTNTELTANTGSLNVYSQPTSDGKDEDGRLDPETEREYERRYAKEKTMERRPTLGGSLLSMVGKVGRTSKWWEQEEKKEENEQGIQEEQAEEEAKIFKSDSEQGVYSNIVKVKDDVSTLSSLPRDLLNDIMLVPRENIRYSPEDIPSPLNAFQGFIEDVTALPWDWWPLPPKVRALEPGETRVYWKCFCGMMRWRELRPGQRKILEELLKKSPANHHRPLLCASIRPTSEERQHMESHQDSDLPPESTPSNSSTGTHHPTLLSSRGIASLGTRALGSQASNSGSMQPTPATSSSGVPPITNATGIKSQRVYFGVNGPQNTRLDQIEDHLLVSDSEFLQRLRKSHSELRGWLRVHLSFWKLSYWEFVKFKRASVLPPQTIEVKPDLPESTDYEYRPRPPKVSSEEPGISQHEFEVIVRLCLERCWLASTPLGHQCQTVPVAAINYIDKIPKFNKNLHNQALGEEYVWGIQARYVVSAIRVFTIHIIIVCVSLGLGVWWQRKHPDDLQGAAVAFSAFLLLISTFWSATGVLKGLR